MCLKPNNVFKSKTIKMSYHNTKGSLISITKCANHEWQSTEVQKNRKWNKAQ